MSGHRSEAKTSRLTDAYFDRLYQQSTDPWRLGTRWYEERKYALTVASLPRRRFRRGFEPGCSVGVLTEQLAQRCDALLATDRAQAAVSATRQRVSSFRHVEVSRLRVPDRWPDGSFDLIVLSEVGYYGSAGDLVMLRDRAIGSLDDDGVLVAVHWRHPVADYPLRGDEVHAVLGGDDRIARLVHHEEPDFLLDVFARRPAISVAAAEGLVPDAAGRLE
jgi:hypothetical protein